MSHDVRVLRGEDGIATIAATEPEANPEIVERLEHLLTEAKRGEILAFGYCGVLNGRRVFRGFHSGLEGTLLVAATSWLFHTTTRWFAGTDDQT